VSARVKVPTETEMNYTEELSRFVVDCRMEHLPQGVVETAGRCVLDWIGVTLGAADDPAVAILLDLERSMGGKRQASILGHGTRVTLLQAALVNGMMSHVLDYDDAHSGTRTHPSAPLVPALFAVGEHLGRTGRDLVEAFVAGFEVTLRIGYALGKTYYEKGWHATPVLGRFGAAAGAAKLLGLNAQEVSVALGLAATQAGGLRDVFGTMGKPFHAGTAAAGGLFAALLAGKGFSAPTNLLDPEAGFARVFTSEYNPEAIVKGLGTEYRTMEVNFKPYAACLLVHPVIDGLITLRREHGLDPDSIEEIHVRVAPLNIKVTGDPEPKNGFQARFSLPMAAALAVIYGRATESLFTDATVNDNRIKAVMGKVKPFPDDSLAETETVVKVVMKDGRDYSSHVVSPKGDPDNPMTFEEIAEKTRDLAEKVLSGRAIDRVIRLAGDLERLDNVATLVRACCPGPRSGGTGRVMTK
jgi:2-methylcitrate dehydratase PrpD